MKKWKPIALFMAACILCLLSMTACAVEPSASAAPVAAFSDLDAGAWYAEDVTYCLENGLMDGSSSMAFSPNAPASRAELAAALYRKAGKPETEARGFSDIPDQSWYADAASWAAEQGIIGGYSDNRFGGEDPVTRQQLAAILWRTRAIRKGSLCGPSADCRLCSGRFFLGSRTGNHQRQGRQSI